MHSDRELLELAAKAAGIEVIWNEHWQSWQRRTPEMDRYGISRFPWNPLTDDGDALRLAVKLELEVSLGQFGTIIYPGNRKVEEVGEDGCDEMALCRRAITRAAAAIGETK